MITKRIDHTEYPKSLKTKTEKELRFIIRDANEEIELNPNNENNSYYADEVCYACNELKRRTKIKLIEAKITSVKEYNLSEEIQIKIGEAMIVITNNKNILSVYFYNDKDINSKLLYKGKQEVQEASK